MIRVVRDDGHPHSSLPREFMRSEPASLPRACRFLHRWRHTDHCSTFYCFQECARCTARQIRRVRYVRGDGYPAPPDWSWACEGFD